MRQRARAPVFELLLVAEQFRKWQHEPVNAKRRIITRQHVNHPKRMRVFARTMDNHCAEVGIHNPNPRCTVFKVGRDLAANFGVGVIRRNHLDRKGGMTLEELSSPVQSGDWSGWDGPSSTWAPLGAARESPKRWYTLADPDEWREIVQDCGFRIHNFEAAPRNPSNNAQATGWINTLAIAE